MGEIIDFPGASERDWIVFESALRESYKGSKFDGEILESALPIIKLHWQKAFQEKSISAVPATIPGPLVEGQVLAIQEAVERHVSAVIEVLKNERLMYIGRLVNLELQIAYFRRHGVE